MIELSNFDSLIREIQHRNRLVLFIGSGVSAEFIPLWEELLNDLVLPAVELGLGNIVREKRKKVAEILSDNHKKSRWSPYEKAGIIKRFLGNHYIRKLHHCLYRKWSAEYKSKFIANKHSLDDTFLGAVAALCQHEQLTAVITYNFDDLLDTIIRTKGRNVYSVYGRNQYQLTGAGLPIYHVHGYLPCDGPLPTEDEACIIFSGEEYFQAMLEPYVWQTTTQLQVLRNDICVFLGTTVRDLDMLRILSHAKTYLRKGIGKTFVLTCRKSILGEPQKFEDDEDRDLAMRVWASLMDDVGIHMIMTGEDFDSVIKYIHKLNDLFTNKQC